MAYMRALNYKIDTIKVEIGDGVNNGLPLFDVKETEATDMQNLDSRKYPAMHVRTPRKDYTTALTTIRHLGRRKNDYLIVVDDTVWKYWNGAWVNILTGLTAADAESIDFMDKTILVNGTDAKYWDGSTSGNVTGMPASHFVTVHANRIYAANKTNQNLNFSALRKYNDWTTANDSGQVVVETRDGEFCSGLTAFANHVMYFKEHSIHELYGTGPYNYSMQVLSNEYGCISHRSIKEVDGKLLWLSYKGVYLYTGGTAPQLISTPWVKGYIDRLDITNRAKACAGTDGIRYYLCLPIDSGSRVLLVYDTVVQQWHVEDSINIIEFTEMNNILYGSTGTQIKNMVDSTGTEAISWYRIWRPDIDGSLSMKKEWDSIYFLCSLPSGSTLNCYLSNDAEGENWTLVKSFTAQSNIQNVEVDIPLTIGQGVDYARIKLSGTGSCTVFAMEKRLRVQKGSYNG